MRFTVWAEVVEFRRAGGKEFALVDIPGATFDQLRGLVRVPPGSVEKAHWKQPSPTNGMSEQMSDYRADYTLPKNGMTATIRVVVVEVRDVCGNELVYVKIPGADFNQFNDLVGVPAASIIEARWEHVKEPTRLGAVVRFGKTAFMRVEPQSPGMNQVWVGGSHLLSWANVVAAADRAGCLIKLVEFPED
jgi:hypothetical protein